MWRFFVLMFLASIMSSSGYSFQYGGMSDDLDDMLLPYLAPPVEKTCTDEQMKMFDAFLTGTKNTLEKKWEDYPEIATYEQYVEEFIIGVIESRYNNITENEARRIDGCYMFTKYCKSGKPEDNDYEELSIDLKLPEEIINKINKVRLNGVEVIGSYELRFGLIAFFTITNTDCITYYTGPRSYTLNDKAGL